MLSGPGPSHHHLSSVHRQADTGLFVCRMYFCTFFCSILHMVCYFQCLNGFVDYSSISHYLGKKAQFPIFWKTTQKECSKIVNAIIKQYIYHISQFYKYIKLNKCLLAMTAETQCYFGCVCWLLNSTFLCSSNTSILCIAVNGTFAH